ncbi:MAG: hypothetical protein K0Q80_1937 [Microvirga sp.]|jgi:hypothetical protein|nr:hypothetical protein [Microvirga sp.]
MVPKSANPLLGPMLQGIKKPALEAPVFDTRMSRRNYASAFTFRT